MPDTPQNQRQGASLIVACRLYRKKSGKGVDYLMGRLGGVRILIMPKKPGEEGEHSHALLMGEAAQREERGENDRGGRDERDERRSGGR